MTESNVQPGVLLPLSPDEVAFLLALLNFVRTGQEPLISWSTTMGDDLEAKLLRVHWPDDHVP